MAQELISIIVPVFNTASYLDECIKSICNQSYQNIEIVLIDDGSTDQSGEICDRYRQKDDRIMVLHQRNMGQVRSTKNGLAVAHGTYIGFVDSDDFIEPDMYEELIKTLCEKQADYVYSDFYANDCKEGRYHGSVDISCDRVAFLNNYILDVDNRLNASKCINLYEASFIRQVYAQVPDDQNWAEDAATMILCGLMAEKIAFCDKTFYHYRKYPASQSRRQNLDKFRYANMWYENIKGKLQEYGIYEQTQLRLDEFYRSMLLEIVNMNFGDQLICTHYFCPLLEDIQGKNVILYGAGNVGQDYYTYIQRQQGCEVVAWVDRNYQNVSLTYQQIQSPEVIAASSYDVIVIAVKSEKLSENIKENLMEVFHCEADKILWKKPISVCRT